MVRNNHKEGFREKGIDCNLGTHQAEWQYGQSRNKGHSLNYAPVLLIIKRLA
jgi:hypothetical protein